MPYLKKLPPLEPCPFEAALAVIGGKWKARILRRLADGPRTFGELKRELNGITQQVLSAALKALEADGMLRRERAESPLPLGSTFTLSADGRSLLEALDTLALWGAARLRRQGLQWAESQAPLSLTRSPALRQKPRSAAGRLVVTV